MKSLLSVLLFAFLSSAYGDTGLNIRLNPQVLMPGASTWLTCRVTPHEDNRKLAYGIAGVHSSERQLEGSKAAITWGPVEFKKLPCGAGPAYCIVERVNGRPLQAMATLEIAPCNVP